MGADAQHSLAVRGYPGDAQYPKGGIVSVPEPGRSVGGWLFPVSLCFLIGTGGNTLPGKHMH
jgi:hypothetical protein